MTKVNFYILKQADEQARQLFVCRLVEKLNAAQSKIYIDTDTQDRAREMDDLLWSFKPDSFIPHALQEAELASEEDLPVIIGTQSRPDKTPDVFINLTDTIPQSAADAATIVEIVCNNDNAKQASRARWNHYKKQGFELNHHQM